MANFTENQLKLGELYDFPTAGAGVVVGGSKARKDYLSLGNTIKEAPDIGRQREKMLPHKTGELVHKRPHATTSNGVYKTYSIKNKR